jgi:formylglycine-generating enzyme required for sulfatase activity
VRGGGWDVGENELRSAYRRAVSRKQAFNTVGLRIAREIK